MHRHYVHLAMAAVACAFVTDVRAVAQTTAQTTTVQVAAEVSTRTVRSEESALANVITDALRAAERTDIAFMPAIAFTERTLPRGPAAIEDLLKALEYRNDRLSVVRLTGDQIVAALEHGLALHPQRSPAFLQVSGVTVTVDPSAERGRRVVSVRVGRAALQADRRYEVAMPAPLANGALAYFRIWSKTDIVREPARTLEAAVSEYLATERTIGAREEERIVFRR
ncbi:MAG TPA: 5'-nucleotidase [Chthonomonadales bacterium]|nr:5'-nucleotidase [Chthonomonadales bacterium]